MRALRFVLSMLIVATLVATTPTQERKATNKEKIIGAWTLVDKYPGIPSLTWEFTKGGKYKVTAKLGNDELIDGEGAYEVDGETIKLKSDYTKKTETWKIKALTEKTLAVEVKEDDDKFTMEFKKK